MSDSENINEDHIKIAEQANLRYVSGTRKFGINRKKAGSGFAFVDKKGKKIQLADSTQKRIKSLNIPPAWQDVWICTDPSGHIQAIGRDEKGRKQYIYHSEWNKQCQENKFNRMVFLGKVLPTIREQIDADIQIKSLDKRKILATLVWLLEHTFIRIGNEEYAQDNNSFGLTTLRNRHVKFQGEDELKFKFIGKSGVEHIVEIKQPKIVKVVRRCVELPGYNLFQYLDEDGKKHVVDSEEVNQYLKGITGEKVTAKDFRTWGGTTLSAETLLELGEFDDEKVCQKNIKKAVKTVSSHLRNTPAVCSAYYIHPTVVNTYQKSLLIPHFVEAEKYKKDKPNKLSFNEFATLELLQKYPLS